MIKYFCSIKTAKDCAFCGTPIFAKKLFLTIFMVILHTERAFQPALCENFQKFFDPGPRILSKTRNAKNMKYKPGFRYTCVIHDKRVNDKGLFCCQPLMCRSSPGTYIFTVSSHHTIPMSIQGPDDCGTQLGPCRGLSENIRTPRISELRWFHRELQPPKISNLKPNEVFLASYMRPSFLRNLNFLLNFW
jgi:hypothetical protein